MTILAIFFALVFFYSLVSAAVERTNFTAPIVFTLAGVLVGIATPDLKSHSFSTEIFLTIAELGLVLLLFTDGSRIGFNFQGGLFSLPGRLLSTGMVLTIGLGLITALLLFGELSIWHAGILAAILAPTDAGLGQAIMSNPRVPTRIREALNVEAGLNDGLSVPFLLFFVAMTAAAAHGVEKGLTDYIVEQFGYGVIIGAVIGRIGSELYAAAQRKGWMSHIFQQIGFAALPVLCVIASEATGASMFIAAFVAGLAVRQKGENDIASRSVEFIEDWGQLINLTVFFLFGLLVSTQWPDLEPVHFLYGILSLTVVRMLPVAIALMGMKLQTSTLLFMGWFGPRGLASIVLGLVYIEHAAGHDEPAIRLTVIATVLMSILAHGLTAKVGANLYARQVAKMPEDAEEKEGSS